MTDRDEIMDLCQRRGRAHHDKNAGVIAACYATDAMIYSLAPPLGERGMGRDDIAAWLATWEGPIRIDVQDMDLAVTDGLVHASALNRMRGTKTDGEEVAAMPGCKSGIRCRVDHIAEHAFPDVQKAVKWNTSLLGKEDGYFIGMYCYKEYVQLTFMQGTSLKPVPPVASKIDGTRYFNIYEDDEFDEVQIEEWAAQAIKLPGEKLQTKHLER